MSDQGLAARTYETFLGSHDKNLALKMGRGFEATFPRDLEKPVESCSAGQSGKCKAHQPTRQDGCQDLELERPGLPRRWGKRGVAQLLQETVRWLPRSYRRTTVRTQQFHPRYVLFTSTHPHVLSRFAQSSQLVESSQVSINE